MVCIRTRTIQDRFSRAALLGHLSSSNGLRSNSNHPEQVSKGRPRHTSYETFGNGRPLASSFELEWFAFELEWSAFKLEPSRTGFQGPPSSHTFYKSLTVVERFSLRLEEAALLGHLSNSNGHLSNSNGHLSNSNGHLSNSNGHLSNSNGHLSNLNCPKQASKGRPRRTPSINPLRSSSGFRYVVWKRPPSWVVFRTRMVIFRTRIFRRFLLRS